MKRISATYKKATLVPKDGVIQIVFEVPIAQLNSEDRFGVSGWQELASWDAETPLELSVVDCQYALPGMEEREA